MIQSLHRSGLADAGQEDQRRHATSRLRLTWWAADRILCVLLVALPGWLAWEADRSYTAAALFGVPAAALLLSGVVRLNGLIKAGRGNDEAPARVRSSRRRVLAPNVLNGQSLEWRVLRWQPPVPDAVRIRGPVAPGRWVVVRLPDGRLVWPRSRAQPVVGTGTLQLPAAILRDEGPLADVHQLLAGYVQTIRLVADLPLMVRRPPGPSRGWWLVGAPRPLVRALDSHAASSAAHGAGQCPRPPGHGDKRQGRRASAQQAAEGEQGMPGIGREPAQTWLACCLGRYRRHRPDHLQPVRAPHCRISRRA